MVRTEPTPSAKREVTLDEASQFLAQHFSSPVSQIKELMGGKHSKAFSFELPDQILIIRFSPDNRGFLKDKFAFEKYGMHLPIPKVVEMGSHGEAYYCITAKVSGETARDQYKRNDFTSLPLLYDAAEKIAQMEPLGTGYGYLDLDGNAPYSSSIEYIHDVYGSRNLFDWEKIHALPFVDKGFTDYVAEKMLHYAQYTTEKRELLHGDFGADNVFVNDSAVSGIIDWEKMRWGDHFLDVGRVLLFCPNRKATAAAAVSFYNERKDENWKERAAMGVYHVVLTNYAYAAMGGNEASCKSSPERLKELEIGLSL